MHGNIRSLDQPDIDLTIYKKQMDLLSVFECSKLKIPTALSI